MKPEITVLLTCMGGDLAPDFIIPLNESDRYNVTTVAVDGNPSAIGRHFAEHFEVVPMGTAVNYIESILAIVKKYGVELVLAGSDGEALALSVAKEEFSKFNCQIACSDAEILRNLNHKVRTYKKLQEAGIICAQWYQASDTIELDKFIKEIYDVYGEVVIKPSISRGGRDVFVIRSDVRGEHHYYGGREIHTDLETLQKKYQKNISDHFPVIVMERLHEPVYDIDVLSWQGEAKRIVPRKRHNPAGIPFEGNTIVNDSVLMDLGKKVAKALDLSWLHDIDVMSRKDGNPVVLEVNPRPSGSCPASIKAGIPLLDDVIAISRGEEIKNIVLEDKTVIISYKTLKRISL